MDTNSEHKKKMWKEEQEVLVGREGQGGQGGSRGEEEFWAFPYMYTALYLVWTFHILKASFYYLWNKRKKFRS